MVQVAPVIDIPFPSVDLDSMLNPIPAITGAVEFALAKRFFAENPAATRSLLGPASQALLYSIIRNQRSAHVAEIGTYRAGTTEALARALVANGGGTAHTVSPFDDGVIVSILAEWPEALLRHVRFYSDNSMGFFMNVDKQNIRLNLVIVDGDHNYEFASFDIEAAARRLNPGGFIFVDNVSQMGPYRAAVDFMARHPEWYDCAERSPSTDPWRAFDRDRSRVYDTDFFVLRAPNGYFVKDIAETFGEQNWPSRELHGLRLSLGSPTPSGTLHVQCILRAFAPPRIDELIGEASMTIDQGATEVEINFGEPVRASGSFMRFRVEPWLSWTGDGLLPLKSIPTPF